ncbi:hypothetical protein [Treponema sp. R80B11-R83G3]
MKMFLVKCLIIFRALRKNNYFLLAIMVVLAIVTYLRGNIKVFRNCLFYSVILMALMLVFSIASMIHRKKHQRFKVYLSFSVRRIPWLTQYISDYLKHAFWIFNIDYYDFREHEQFHFLNEFAICAEIDKNLADSDIFLRFIDKGLEPNKPRLVRDLWEDIRFNPFTRELSSIPDYAKYEVDISYDKFGFTNPNNRFQIVSTEIMVSPMEHIQTIYIDTEDSHSALNFTLKVINKLSQGNQEQQYWKRRYLF